MSEITQKENHGDPHYLQEDCNITICPCCHKGTLIVNQYFTANAPPPTINNPKVSRRRHQKHRKVMIKNTPLSTKQLITNYSINYSPIN